MVDKLPLERYSVGKRRLQLRVLMAEGYFYAERYSYCPARTPGKARTQSGRKGSAG